MDSVDLGVFLKTRKEVVAITIHHFYGVMTRSVFEPLRVGRRSYNHQLWSCMVRSMHTYLYSC